MKTTKLILLVDDDADDREFFTDALNKVDPSIKYAIARDGIEALDYLNHASVLPDFIFLDLNMPRMDGKEFLKEKLLLKDLLTVPVIIYSTSKSEKDQKETLELGAELFIQKPNNYKSICEAISEVITGQYKNMEKNFR